MRISYLDFQQGCLIKNDGFQLMKIKYMLPCNRTNYRFKGTEHCIPSLLNDNKNISQVMELSSNKSLEWCYKSTVTLEILWFNIC